MFKKDVFNSFFFLIYVAHICYNTYVLIGSENTLLNSVCVNMSK